MTSVCTHYSISFCDIASASAYLHMHVVPLLRYRLLLLHFLASRSLISPASGRKWKFTELGNTKFSRSKLTSSMVEWSEDLRYVNCIILSFCGCFSIGYVLLNFVLYVSH